MKNNLNFEQLINFEANSFKLRKTLSSQVETIPVFSNLEV
jgi:hypothetical protein